MVEERIESTEEQLPPSLRLAFRAGFIAGLSAFAWWKDGVRYVGTSGTTLAQAIELVHDGEFDPC